MARPWYFNGNSSIRYLVISSHLCDIGGSNGIGNCVCCQPGYSWRTQCMCGLLDNLLDVSIDILACPAACLILVFPAAYLFLEHLAALMVSEGQCQV